MTTFIDRFDSTSDLRGKALTPVEQARLKRCRGCRWKDANSCDRIRQGYFAPQCENVETCPLGKQAPEVTETEEEKCDES